MRQRHIYAAIREAREKKGYPIELACELLHVARSSYHKWVSGKLSQRAAENERLADTIEKIHEESPDTGLALRIVEKYEEENGWYFVWCDDKPAFVLGSDIQFN